MATRRLTTLTNRHLFAVPSPLLLSTIDRLIRLPTVRSVSCPFRDPVVWRLLADEQLRRAASTGLHPQLAFGLAGPDAGLVYVPLHDWGAYVHIPYEGAASADLFIRPSWRNTFAERGGEDGSLSEVVHGIEVLDIGRYCHHLLTNDDMGELACASREEIGEGWVAYESKHPYAQANRRWPQLALRDD